MRFPPPAPWSPPACSSHLGAGFCSFWLQALALLSLGRGLPFLVLSRAQRKSLPSPSFSSILLVHSEYLGEKFQVFVGASAPSFSPWTERGYCPPGGSFRSSLVLTAQLDTPWLLNPCRSDFTNECINLLKTRDSLCIFVPLIVFTYDSRYEQRGLLN